MFFDLARSPRAAAVYVDPAVSHYQDNVIVYADAI